MKLNLIKSIYRNKKLSQNEKSLMTSLVLNMDKERKCTISLAKIADENNIKHASAWRIMKRIISKQLVKSSRSVEDKTICTYEIAI